VGGELGLELGHGIGAGARDGLVGVDHDPLDADAVADGHQDRHQLHRRAVGIGDDPGVCGGVGGVDLADDERHTRIHPPGVRVVDHRRTVADGGRCKLQGNRGAGREQGDIDAFKRLGQGLDDRMGDAADQGGAPGGAARRHEPELTHGEFALQEDLDHRPPDETGGADNGDGERLARHEGHASTALVKGTNRV
jgi:hypothetical protein